MKRTSTRFRVAAAIFVLMLTGCGGSGNSGSAPQPNPNAAAPTVQSISPSTITANAAAVPITVTGTGFLPTSQVLVNGAGIPTIYVNGTELQATIPQSMIVSAGRIAITVSNGSTVSDSAASASAVAVNNPQPALASVAPASVLVGSGEINLDLKGTGFVTGASVYWGTSSLPTKFLSSTELIATVGVSLLAQSGSFPVRVVNPAPAGGQSNDLSFDVANPAPTLTKIAPQAVLAARAATITLTGSGFNSATLALWNGNPRPTTLVNPSTLTVALAASDLSSAGSGTITVANAPPGGGTSATQKLFISAVPVPTLTNITLTLVPGDPCPAIQVRATGTNLLNAILYANGQQVSSAGYSFIGITGSLPPGFAAKPGALTFVAKPSGYGPSGASSEDYVYPASAPPIATFCSQPAPATIYPGSSFQLAIAPTSVNITDSVTVTSLVPPAGITVEDSLPFTVPFGSTKRLQLKADATLAAGNYLIAASGNAGSMTVASNLPLVAKATAPPSFSISLPIWNEVGVPIGGSTTLSGSVLANSLDTHPDYNIALSLSGLPSGTTATITPDRVIPGDSFKVTISAAQSAPVAQNVSVSLIGTPEPPVSPASSGFLLDVTPQPGTLPSNRTDFVATGDTPNQVVYDRVHNAVYASNPSWNRIDIISNTTHTLLRSIPLRGVTAIDLSQDGSTLWIGTDSRRVFAMNTSTFGLNQYMLPLYNGGSFFDATLMSMADGTLLMNLTTLPGNGSSYNAVWNPTSNVLTPLSTSFYFNMRSGDGRHAYGVSADSVACHAVRYDVDSKSLINLPDLQERCGLKAVNQDGSKLVAYANSVYGIYDDSLNLLNTVPASMIDPGIYPDENFVFSPDSTTLYESFSPNSGPFLITIDIGTQTVKGVAPGVAGLSAAVFSNLPDIVGVDDTGMLIERAKSGVLFEDTTYFQTYGAHPIGQGVPISFTPNVGPVTGGTVSSPYGAYSLIPDIWYGKNRGAVSSRDAASGTISFISPAGDAPGVVNLKYIFPDGAQVLTPRAFSYSVFPEYSISGGANPNGGSPGRISGFGMPADASGGSIMVGSSPAAITTQATQYPPSTGDAFKSTFLDYTIPAGTPGFADLQISTQNGAATLPKAVFYAKSVQDYASSDTFSSILYDTKRNQVYLAAKDHIDIFSVSSGQFVTALRPAVNGGSSDFRGMALTPDGNQLLATNLQDGSLAVINPDNPSDTFAVPIATPFYPGATCQRGSFAVAALTGRRALVVSGLPPGVGGCALGNSRYFVDLQTRTATAAPYLPNGCGDSILQSTDDGTLVVLSSLEGSACLYSAVSNTYRAGPPAYSYRGATISGDGTLIGVGNVFANPTGDMVGEVGRPVVFYGANLYPGINNYPADMLMNPLLNASGSLYFWPYSNHFDIIDSATGILRLRFSLAEKIQAVQTPMAIDPTGRMVFLITDKGFTFVDLGSPLLSAIGSSPTVAAQGAQIQVRGSGFLAGVSATIGDKPAATSLVDSSTLTVTIPDASPGPQDITVTNVDGATYTLHSGVTIQ